MISETRLLCMRHEPREQLVAAVKNKRLLPSSDTGSQTWCRRPDRWTGFLKGNIYHKQSAEGFFFPLTFFSLSKATYCDSKFQFLSLQIVRQELDGAKLHGYTYRADKTVMSIFTVITEEFSLTARSRKVHPFDNNNHHVGAAQIGKNPEWGGKKKTKPLNDTVSAVKNNLIKPTEES